MHSKLSIIIPVLDDAIVLAATLGHSPLSPLSALQDLRQRGHEVLVVDGGSRDGSVTIARRLADRVLISGPGRALQMNAGAESASHDILLFLHADSVLPADADALIGAALSAPGRCWGHFHLRSSGTPPASRLSETLNTWRMAVSGMPCGARALFVERTYFERVGGYDDLSMQEGAALSRKLLRHARPVRIHARSSTSSGPAGLPGTGSR